MMGPKYELAERDEATGLWRIRALRDIPERGVRAGDLGGLVGSEANLSQFGSAWVSGSAWVFGSARVFGSAEVSGSARVYGSAWVLGSAEVSGSARVYGSAWVSGSARAYDSARVKNSTHLLSVSGLATPEARDAHLYRATKKSGGHRVRVGCWSGTVAELRDLANGDAWPSGNGPEYRDEWRPSLLALADLFAARVAAWGDRDPEARTPKAVS